MINRPLEWLFEKKTENQMTANKRGDQKKSQNWFGQQRTAIPCFFIYFLCWHCTFFLYRMCIRAFGNLLLSCDLIFLLLVMNCAFMRCSCWDWALNWVDGNKIVFTWGLSKNEFCIKHINRNHIWFCMSMTLNGRC